MLLILIAGLLLQQPAKEYPLQRYDVLRVGSDDLRRLPESIRGIFIDPIPNVVPVNTLDEATKRAGFTPKILKSPKVDQLYATNPVNEHAKINVSELTTALRDAKIGNVEVPPAWNDVVVSLTQPAGVLADYGEFFVVQAPLAKMSAPAGFSLDQFMDVLFRIMGIPVADSTALRQRFAAGPSLFFQVPRRYEMSIRQVPIGSGTGVLLQNGDKVGELALMWATADRSYFLSGALTEDEAIAAAKSLQ